MLCIISGHLNVKKKHLNHLNCVNLNAQGAWMIALTPWQAHTNIAKFHSGNECMDIAFDSHQHVY